MSYDDWRQEYHLTPRGWVKGTYRYYDKVQGDPVPRPTEAVETWEEHCTQASGWSHEDYAYREIWHDPDWSLKDRSALHGKSPPPWEAQSN